MNKLTNLRSSMAKLSHDRLLDVLEKQNVKIKNLEQMVANSNQLNSQKFHNYVKSWEFGTVNECKFANAFAAYGEENGLSNNDVMQLFPALCRIAKSTGQWSGIKK